MTSYLFIFDALYVSFPSFRFSEKDLNAFAETILEIYQTNQKNDRQVWGNTSFLLEADRIE